MARHTSLVNAFRSSLQWISYTSKALHSGRQFSTFSRKMPATKYKSFSSAAGEQPTQKTFQHEKAEKVFQQMTPLNREEISTIGELINEILGIKISEFDDKRATEMGKGSEAGEEEVQEETKKTSFDLTLTGFDAKSKIKVIKEVRAITSLGLRDAKEMVEAAPKVVLKDIKMEKAEELKQKLEKVGATVEIA